MNKTGNVPQVCIGRKKYINSIISDTVKSIKLGTIKECLGRAYITTGLQLRVNQRNELRKEYLQVRCRKSVERGTNLPSHRKQIRKEWM